MAELPSSGRCNSCVSHLVRDVLDRSGRGGLTLVDGSSGSNVRFAVVDTDLVLLVPHSSGLLARCAMGEEPVACLQATDDDTGVGLHLLGWVSPVASNRVRSTASKFAERHLTGDLLDLGVRWGLTKIEVAAATLMRDGHEFELHPHYVAVALSHQ